MSVQQHRVEVRLYIRRPADRAELGDVGGAGQGRCMLRPRTGG
jgi:hypothetical protein